MGASRFLKLDGPVDHPPRSRPAGGGRALRPPGAALSRRARPRRAPARLPAADHPAPAGGHAAGNFAGDRLRHGDPPPAAGRGVRASGGYRLVAGDDPRRSPRRGDLAVARPGRSAGRPGRRVGDRRGRVGGCRALRRRPRAHARPRAGPTPGAPGPRPRRHVRLPHPQRRLCLVSVPRTAARPRHPSPIDRPLSHRRRTGGAGRRRRPHRPSAGAVALHPPGRFACRLGSGPGGPRPARSRSFGWPRSVAAWRSRPTGPGCESVDRPQTLERVAGPGESR